MGTYNTNFENRIETQRCPFCGKTRPLDWFGKRALKIVIRSAKTYSHVRTIVYRKFKACWKCREFNRALRFEIDPYTLVPEHYRTRDYTITAQRDSKSDEKAVSENDLLIG